MLAIPQSHPAQPLASSGKDVPPLRETLLQLLGDIVIHGPLQFQIGNRPAVFVNTSTTTAQPITKQLSEALWPELYNCAYARPYLAEQTPAPSTRSSAELLLELRAAFPEGGRWSSDWEVYKTEVNGAAHVRKGDCCRHLLPGSFALSAPGPVREKSLVSIMLPLASSQTQPAFYHVSGHAPHSDHDDAALARLYFNTKPETVTPLMVRIVAQLNAYAVPFRAKTLIDPAAYDRTDGTVFYLARRHLPFALSVLRDLFLEQAPDLGSAVPLFAKRIVDGIGGADDPGFGMSFGQTRAMLVADAIVEAWAAGKQTAQARFEQLEKRFTAAGLSLAAPHLNAGNIEIYAFSA